MTSSSKRRSAWWAAPVLALALLAGCGGSDSGDSDAPSAKAGDTKVQSGDVAVEIKGFDFDPADLTVKAGSKVTWTNEDSATHTVTSKEGPAEFDSKSKKKGDSFSFTFEEPGTYEYICNIHSQMKATVTVR